MKTELLHKYFRGETTEKEESQIVEWTESSAENKERFLKERMLFDITLFSDDSKIQRKPKGHLYLYPLIAIAAMLAIVFVMDLPHMHKPKQQLSQTIRIPAGQRAQMDLPDGSVVWLNSQTTLTYDENFGKKDRKVTLDGEAYFDVARNEKCPFIVHTHAMDIEVLGTKFNVEAYAKQQNFEASLIQGKIKIKSPSDNNISQVLLPDYKSTLKNGKLVISKIEDYNIYRWKEGLYCFKNKSFIEIIKDLEKYYNLKIIVDKPSITNIILTGKFRISDGLDYALRILQKDVPFIYNKHTTDDIIYIK